MSNERETKLWSLLEWYQVLIALIFLILIVASYFYVSAQLEPSEDFWTHAGKLYLDIVANVIPVILAFLLAFFMFRRVQELRSEKEADELISRISSDFQNTLSVETQNLESNIQEDLSTQFSAINAELSAQRQFLEIFQEASANLKEFVEDFEDFSLGNWASTGSWRVEKDDRGNFLVVTNSEMGGFAKPCLLWTDYIFEFETKIIRSNSSWIIRATNHANYVMLQCELERITPHFRVNGYWYFGDPIQLDPSLVINQWFGVRITARGPRVAINITLNGNYRDVFDDILLEPPLKIVPRRENDPPILIYSYPIGSVGFRASGKETAYFRNVSVRRA